LLCFAATGIELNLVAFACDRKQIEGVSKTAITAIPTFDGHQRTVATRRQFGRPKQCVKQNLWRNKTGNTKTLQSGFRRKLGLFFWDSLGVGELSRK